MDKHKSRFTKSSNQPQPPLPQGNKRVHVHRQRQALNLASDSGSSSGGVADKDSSSFKFGWRSSKQLFGTPIKKLLAEEMSAKTESKRRSPGVIARLMGLDGLPSNKQHKGLSENHPQKTAQLEKTSSLGVTNDGPSSRRSLKDQQEFKDVFEVSEIQKVESSRYPSQGCAELMTADAEMSFIEQKFMDAKRLATHQDLQSSRDFRDTLEVLDSNKDLLLKYFKRPDSLFKKHLNDLQAAPVQSHFGHVEAMDIEKQEHDLNGRSDREKMRLNYNRSHEKHHDGYPSHFDKRHVMHSSPKSSKLQFRSRHEQDAVPTKIVVLKPNLGKGQNGTRFVSSPCSPHNLSVRENDAEFSSVKCRQTELCQVANLPESARSWRQYSFESREIAKEVTRQMKNSLNNGGMMLSNSRFRGYAGDDSSRSVSGNESPEESEETMATLGSSFDVNNRSRRSSRSSESSVSREAKKRLSERWKVAHKSQEVRGISRSSTLAEMLAIPDKELKVANFESMAIASAEGFHGKCTPSSEPAKWVEPLGISSRDGWKDECIGSLPRSKSLPSSSTAFGSPRTFLRTEGLRDDRFMVLKEAHKRERRRAAKSIDHRHGVHNRGTESGHKKSWSLHSSKLEVDEFSPDLQQNRMKINIEGSPKLEVLASEYLAENARDTSAVTDDHVDVTNGSTVGSSQPPNKVLPELSSHVLIKSNCSAVDKGNSIHQDLSAGSSDGSSVLYEPPVPGLESSCCKDTDQPSPISVLEPSFTDDVSSSSECFGNINVHIQGLRVQIDLLKSSGPEEYVEGPMILSDEDGEEATIEILEYNGTEDSWECFYIIDVLSESGIHGAHPDTRLKLWHSLECPVSPLVFDELEKKYIDWNTCSRVERRMLFDRINSATVKINKQCTNALPWVGLATPNIIGSNLTKNGFIDGLCRMLESDEKAMNEAKNDDEDMLPVKDLVKDLEWMNLRDDIDVIGREVERFILDDLVAEIVGA